MPSRTDSGVIVPKSGCGTFRVARSFHEKAGACQEGFPLFLPQICFRSAKPPLSPSFHPHSWLSDFRSVHVGRSRFSRCCHLIIDLHSPLQEGSWAPGLSRSHLNSAVKLGRSVTNSLRCRAHRFLAVAQGFVDLSAHPQPMQQYR